MSELCLGNCALCPSVMHVQQKLASMQEAQEQMLESFMDPKYDEIVAPEVHDAVSSLHGELSDALREVFETPQSIVVALRKQAAAQADRNDIVRNTIIESTNNLTSNCGGPLEMHAQKAGHIVTVMVCNSPEAPQGEHCEEVRVAREHS